MHNFIGKWITDSEFYKLEPRNVFARQLKKPKLDCTEHRNRHVLFRKKFTLMKKPTEAKIFISADDVYKLYINGNFVNIGPAPAYHVCYNYNVLDVTDHLTDGENTIAVHTLYQGLINRVWQSGDNRHGLILDLYTDGALAVKSDESFLTARHTAYNEIGTAGYDTQFLESFDANAPEIGFEFPDFNDDGWENAKISEVADHVLVEQATKNLVLEKITPVSIKGDGGRIVADFGSNYVGYLTLTVSGTVGSTVTVRLAQELDENGDPRYKLRANCVYEEPFILSDGLSTLEQFDYKSARYAEILLPEGCDIKDIYFTARHYPFELKAKIRPEYESNDTIKRIWELCVNTQKYGPQEAVLDCMEREKGFYTGDGCYTALTHAILSGDDSIARKLIDESFKTNIVTDTQLNCLNCSHMQEIAEYPLMVVKFILWHYNLVKDRDYLYQNFAKATALLDAYRRDYENNCLLSNLDKWCVVEWPANFRDGYDVEITEGKVCKTAHIVINAYYIDAISAVNKMAKILGLPEYRSIDELKAAFINAFYDEDSKLFKDSNETDHKSLIANVFAFAFELYPDEETKLKLIDLISERGISAVGIFASFPILEGLVRAGREDLIIDHLLDESAWQRMLREDATTTFEGWGKDTKWNTSLFHLTMSYAAAFIADTDLKQLLSGN